MNDATLSLKATFNTTVDLYHRRRPHYPAELFEKLIAETNLRAGAELLEIGPGTGQATKPLAIRGYNITAVELGAELAARLRKELKTLTNISVISSAFEKVKLLENQFDLIYSATAFHWIEPQVKFTKTHRLLMSGGYLAIIHTEHVSDEQGDDFFFASLPIHEKYRGKGRQINKQGDLRPPTLADLQPPEEIDTELFTPPTFSVFP